MKYISNLYRIRFPLASRRRKDIIDRKHGIAKKEEIERKEEGEGEIEKQVEIWKKWVWKE